MLERWQSVQYLPKCVTRMTVRGKSISIRERSWSFVFSPLLEFVRIGIDESKFVPFRFFANGECDCISLTFYLELTLGFLHRHSTIETFCPPDQRAGKVEDEWERQWNKMRCSLCRREKRKDGRLLLGWDEVVRIVDPLEFSPTCSWLETVLTADDSAHIFDCNSPHNLVLVVSSFFTDSVTLLSPIFTLSKKRTLILLIRISLI